MRFKREPVRTRYLASVAEFLWFEQVPESLAVYVRRSDRVTLFTLNKGITNALTFR